MASPTVRGTPAEGAGASATTHTITFAQNTGDRVVIFLANDATARTWSLGDSFTNLTNTSATFHIFTKVLDGSEGGDMVATAGVATKSAWIAYNITNQTHHGPTAPVFSTVATGTSTAPNAGSLTPSGGSADYLWLTAFGQAGEEADDDTWVTGTPTSFSNLLQKATGTSGAVTVNCQMGSAQYAFTGSVLDAAAFTTAQSLAWRAYTVAIYPLTNTACVPTAASLTLTGATPTVAKTDNKVCVPGPVGGASYSSTAIADSPTAYWRLGEPSGTNANDEIGTNDGTYVASPTLGVAGALVGDSNTGVTLNGTTQYVEVADDNALDLGDTVSAEAWVKRARSGVSEIIWSKGSQGCLNFSSANTVRWDNNGAVEATSSSTITDTNWHHIVGTHTTGATKLYIDGVDVTVITAERVHSSSAEPVRIGQQVGGGGEFLSGSVDEVAVYSTALSSTRVAAHYAAGTGTGGLKLTGATPTVTVSAPANITALPTAASLTLTGATPTVVAVQVAAPTAVALTLTGATPAVALAIRSQPTVGALTLTGATPTVAAVQVAAPTAASLTLTGATPTVAVAANITSQPTAAALNLTGATPTVAAGGSQSRQPTAVALTVTGATPTVVAGGTQSRQPTAAALTISGATPTVAAGGSQSRQPTAASLTLTGATPTVAAGGTQSRQPTAAALALTGATPTVTVASGVVAQPTAASLTLTGAVPDVEADVEAEPTAASLTLTGATPTVSAGGTQSRQPTPASLTLAGDTPVVAAGGSQSRQPTAIALLLTAFAPDVVLSDHKLASPTPAALTLAGVIPIVDVGVSGVAVPTPAALTLTGAVPDIQSRTYIGGYPPGASAILPGIAATATGHRPGGTGSNPTPGGVASNPVPGA